MRFLAAIWLSLPLWMLAQNDPPPEVDQALRARINEFYSDQINGSFRKAEPLVAEDTQDYYFAQEKKKILAFTVRDIKYTDHFTKATVTIKIRRMTVFGPGFPESPSEETVNVTWKIEEGKWVWYYDPKAPQEVTPMGPSVITPGANSGAPLPDLSDKAIKERAKGIVSRYGLDKSEVSLSASKKSTARVVFHNGQNGYVRVFVSLAQELEGFTVSIEKRDIKGGEDAAITLEYRPGKTPPPQRLQVVVTVEPFNRTIPIAVKFEP